MTPIDPANMPVVASRFMVTITEPGTYRLSGNLIVPDADTTAIEINADNVIIDLGGYAIAGPVSCSPPPVSCSATGTGNGVHAVSRDNIVVRNGTISGMGNVGIYLETNTGRIENVTLANNAGGGTALFGGVIVGSAVQSNGGDGITGIDLLLQGTAVRDNEAFGFKAYGNSAYANSLFIGNNRGGAQVNAVPEARGGNLCNGSMCP
ncbi:right-handed parallel beta-helix repeat-containing protein [Noviherbaspirillum cavernae]|uniref:right-handed parallel beta-helix repeat-containing protein n=1 Tax=Noviherbaspirillum cavernae TaxID=2320862 RepID=UPI0011C4AA54|nr:right-handed parallel beta-helix repeat-containing protein [Noviherbaspirillum cavernae]